MAHPNPMEYCINIIESEPQIVDMKTVYFVRNTSKKLNTAKERPYVSKNLLVIKKNTAEEQQLENCINKLINDEESFQNMIDHPKLRKYLSN